MAVSLDQLQAFVAAAEAGSFSGAAAWLRARFAAERVGSPSGEARSG